MNTVNDLDLLDQFGPADLISTAIIWLHNEAEKIIVSLGANIIQPLQAKAMRLEARRLINGASCLAAIPVGTELRNVGFLWRVPSERIEGEFYLAGPKTCNCPGGSAGKMCKHMAASVALTAAKEAIKLIEQQEEGGEDDGNGNDSIWTVGVIHTTATGLDTQGRP